MVELMPLKYVQLSPVFINALCSTALTTFILVNQAFAIDPNCEEPVCGSKKDMFMSALRGKNFKEIKVETESGNGQFATSCNSGGVI